MPSWSQGGLGEPDPDTEVVDDSRREDPGRAARPDLPQRDPEHPRQGVVAPGVGSGTDRGSPPTQRPFSNTSRTQLGW